MDKWDNFPIKGNKLWHSNKAQFCLQISFEELFDQVASKSDHDFKDVALFRNLLTWCGCCQLELFYVYFHLCPKASIASILRSTLAIYSLYKPWLIIAETNRYSLCQWLIKPLARSNGAEDRIRLGRKSEVCKGANLQKNLILLTEIGNRSQYTRDICR